MHDSSFLLIPLENRFDASVYNETIEILQIRNKLVRDMTGHSHEYGKRFVLLPRRILT